MITFITQISTFALVVNLLAIVYIIYNINKHFNKKNNKLNNNQLNNNKMKKDRTDLIFVVIISLFFGLMMSLLGVSIYRHNHKEEIKMIEYLELKSDDGRTFKIDKNDFNSLIK